MSQYYMNEAALFLPAARRVTDRTVHTIEVVTDEGVEVRLSVIRTPLAVGEAVAERLGALVAEKERALRGFTMLSIGERRYPTLAGIEVRLRYRGEGPLVFQHQLHCAVGSETETTWLAFHGETAWEHADACDRWMAEMLEGVRLRDG